MKNVINPRNVLRQLKKDRASAPTISSSDLLEIDELGITVPFATAMANEAFYLVLKKAVSDYNSEAALAGTAPIDFDDLHTKYSEYVEVMANFITK
ncbi:MAG: hypothetical protein FWE07_06785 [Turicibacter sp.]|nr:hypothetical protein [Turicibacter sp.]